MKIKWDVVLDDILERGLQMGWNRAHKHTDTPEVSTILGRQHEAITELLYEVIDFGDDHEG